MGRMDTILEEELVAAARKEVLKGDEGRNLIENLMIYISGNT